MAGEILGDELVGESWQRVVRERLAHTRVRPRRLVDARRPPVDARRELAAGAERQDHLAQRRHRDARAARARRAQSAVERHRQDGGEPRAPNSHAARRRVAVPIAMPRRAATSASAASCSRKASSGCGISIVLCKTCSCSRAARAPGERVRVADLVPRRARCRDGREAAERASRDPRQRRARRARRQPHRTDGRAHEPGQQRLRSRARRRRHAAAPQLRGDRVEFTVHDNGPGIAPSIQSRVFEPFFSTRPAGTGLGLAVVKTVAEAHGGDARARLRAGSRHAHRSRPAAHRRHVESPPAAAAVAPGRSHERRGDDSRRRGRSPAARRARHDARGSRLQRARGRRRRRGAQVARRDVERRLDRQRRANAARRRPRAAQAPCSSAPRRRPVLLMTAYGTIEQAVAAMRDGAVDYLVKPFEAEELERRVARYCAPPAVASATPSRTSQPIAEDPREPQAARARGARRAERRHGAPERARAARARKCSRASSTPRSKRSAGPFVAVNCAAIPEQMLEALLFGHEKGAFTGAQARSVGKFVQANGGTLLLDEVTEMDLSLAGQAAARAAGARGRAARRQQARSARRARARDEQPRSRASRARRPRFARICIYRLSVFPLRIAPLRERPGDIARARAAFHRGARRRSRSSLSPLALARLRAYSWPGNVRELENVMQRALLLSRRRARDRARALIAARRRHARSHRLPTPAAPRRAGSPASCGKRRRAASWRRSRPRAARAAKRRSSSASAIARCATSFRRCARPASQVPGDRAVMRGV